MTNRNPHLDADCAPLATILDALAAADQHRDGLDARVIASTRSIIAAAPSSPRIHEPAPRQRRPRTLLLLSRAAVAMVLLVGVSVAWIGLKPAQPSPVAPVDVDALLAGLEALDSGASGRTAAINDLASEAAGVESSIRTSVWSFSDLIDQDGNS